MTRSPGAPAEAGAIRQAQIQVNSNPFGARILRDGGFVGTAPTTVSVDVDATGILMADVSITAEFQNPDEASMPVSTLNPNDVTRDFAAGDLAPLSIYVTPDGASVRRR